MIYPYADHHKTSDQANKALLGSPHLDDLGGPRDGARELRYRS